MNALLKKIILFIAINTQLPIVCMSDNDIDKLTAFLHPVAMYNIKKKLSDKNAQKNNYAHENTDPEEVVTQLQTISADQQKLKTQSKQLYYKRLQSNALIATPVILAITKIQTNSTHRNRILGIDDAMAASAATTLIKPLIFTGIGMFAWHKIDYWIHAEDRYKYTKLKDDIDKRLEKLENAISKKHEKIYDYINTKHEEALQKYEAQQKALLRVCAEQKSYIQQQLQSVSHDCEKRNSAVTALTQKAQENITAARSELHAIQESIKLLKSNHEQMKVQIKAMVPMLEQVHRQTTALVHKTEPEYLTSLTTEEQNLLTEELNAINIPQDNATVKNHNFWSWLHHK